MLLKIAAFTSAVNLALFAKNIENSKLEDSTPPKVVDISTLEAYILLVRTTHDNTLQQILKKVTKIFVSKN